MANVFAILSAIALAAALFLTSKNKDAYATEITARKDAEAKLEKETNRYNGLVTQFTSTQTERKSTEDNVATLKETEADSTKKNAAADKVKTAKAAESDANEKKIAAIQENVGDVNQISELASKAKRLSEELASLTDEITSSTSKLNNLTGEKTRTDGLIAGMRKRNSDISNKISFFAKSSISSIYPNFGFVTIPVGSGAGAVPGSTLNVVRDGAVVGKLRVRTVEASRSSADIVPDSLAENTTLMVGDRVVPATDGPAPAKPAAK